MSVEVERQHKGRSWEIAAWLRATQELQKLRSTETEAWSNFFGRDIDVPPPPVALFDALSNAEDHGITLFDPHFLFEGELSPRVQYPGWTVRPEKSYWSEVKKGKKDMEEPSSRLKGAWVLIDRTPRPRYDRGSQMYENDSLGELIKGSREFEIKGMFQGDKGTKFLQEFPQSSRFGLNTDIIYNIVYSRLPKLLGVGRSQVTCPRMIEFNVLGNLFYPHFGEETDTYEFFHDTIWKEKEWPSGWGKPTFGNMTTLHPFDEEEYKNGRIGFRPMVTFSEDASRFRNLNSVHTKTVGNR